MENVRIKCWYGNIELSVKEGIIEFMFDGGDGMNLLTQKQIKSVYEFLNKQYDK